MTAAEVVRYEPTGNAAVDRAVRYWGQASLLPKQYRAEGGAVDWPNLTIAATCLQVLDVEPFPNLPDTYVVNGRVGLMHGIQIALAQRADVFPDLLESDDTHALVELIHGESWRCPRCLRGGVHTAVVTMAQATRAGWTKRNPNYGTMPDRMLAARAVTAAIDHHAPGVLRGIASAVSSLAALETTEGAPLPGGGSVGQIPPASPTPAGYQTWEVPANVRDDVLAKLARLEAVDPAAAAELRAEWKSLRGPVILYDAATPEGRRGYLPDALVLRYMLDELLGALGASGGAAPAPTDEHDATPDPGGTGPDAGLPYAPDDPGRPF